MTYYRSKTFERVPPKDSVEFPISAVSLLQIIASGPDALLKMELSIPNEDFQLVAHTNEIPMLDIKLAKPIYIDKAVIKVTNRHSWEQDISLTVIGV